MRTDWIVRKHNIKFNETTSAKETFVSLVLYGRNSRVFVSSSPAHSIRRIIGSGFHNGLRWEGGWAGTNKKLTLFVFPIRVLTLVMF